MAFSDLMFNERRPAEALERYAGADYRQHNPATRPGRGDHDYAGIDIFRLDEDGKVVEHWDVLHVVPEHSAHDNGMF